MAVRQATRRFESIPEFLGVWRRELKSGAMALRPEDLEGEAAPNLRVDLVLPIVGRLGPIPTQVVSRGADGSTYLKIPAMPDEVTKGVDQLLAIVEQVSQYLLDSGQHVPRDLMEQAVLQAVSAAQQQAQDELRALRRELAERPTAGAGHAEAAVVTSVKPGERGFVIPEVSELEPVFDGALGDRSLRDALVQLALHRSTGLLVVFGEDGVRRFGLWERGGPVGFRLEPIDQRSVLGVLLYRAGKVDKAQLKQSLVIMEKQSIRQGEALIQLGCLNFPQLVMALQKQVELHLQKIMRIDQGVWAFFPLDSLPERFVTPPLNVPSILFRALLNYSRQLSMEIIADAHRPNMDRYVYFTDGVADAAAEINFKATERKFLEIMASNSWRLRELFSVSNLSRTDTSAVVWALNEMGFLEFRTMETADRYITRVGNRINQKTKQLTKGSLFDILEVHWICVQPEIDKALARVKAEFSGRDYEHLPPEMVQQVEVILAKVQEAYEVLSDERQRRTLRQELIEKDMINASAEILAKKGEMAVLKNDARAAQDCWGKAVELQPNNGAYRDGYNRSRGM